MTGQRPVSLAGQRLFGRRSAAEGTADFVSHRRCWFCNVNTVVPANVGLPRMDCLRERIVASRRPSVTRLDAIAPKTRYGTETTRVPRSAKNDSTMSCPGRPRRRTLETRLLSALRVWPVQQRWRLISPYTPRLHTCGELLIVMASRSRKATDASRFCYSSADEPGRGIARGRSRPDGYSGGLAPPADAVVMLLYSTGMRAGELRHLQMGDIDGRPIR